MREPDGAADMYDLTQFDGARYQVRLLAWRSSSESEFMSSFWLQSLDTDSSAEDSVGFSLEEAVELRDLLNQLLPPEAA